MSDSELTEGLQRGCSLFAHPPASISEGGGFCEAKAGGSQTGNVSAVVFASQQPEGVKRVYLESGFAFFYRSPSFLIPHSPYLTLRACTTKREPSSSSVQVVRVSTWSAWPMDTVSDTLELGAVRA